MKKTKTTINATAALTEISKVLENSAYRILRHYTPSLGTPRTDDHMDRRIRSKQLEMELPAQSSELSDTFKDYVEQLGTFLKTTPVETLLFVATYSIQLLSGCNVDYRDFNKYFGFSGLDFLPLKKDFDSIIKKGLVRNVGKRRRNDEFRVSKEAEDSILGNTPFKIKKAKPIDRYMFCQIISSLLEDRNQEEIDTRDLFFLAEKEEDVNKNLSFLTQTTKLLPSINDRVLFYEICNDFVSHRGCRTSVECTLADIYDSNRMKFDVAKSIMEGSNELVTKELIELLPTQFFSEAEVVLTEKGKRLFLEEDFDLFETKAGNDRRLLSPDKIPERELFFNDELTQSIHFLKKSLEEESFVALQKRLEEKSLSKGVAVLLHGLPGTGKTAVAEHLAKSTGRSVYHVDIAASKSCWFGQSEKLFKRIFDDYRQMCKTEERKPILLFNEADALFSKRRDVDSGNCAQTENALQNILLEEMEKLDGILVATTNLCDNFDSAFERRFLFKIHFGKPTTDAKKSIWKSKMSWLSDDESAQLASRYDLSGGEIDNIVRKALMEEVLSGQRPAMAELEAWCRGEKLRKGKCSTIGFTN